MAFQAAMHTLERARFPARDAKVGVLLQLRPVNGAEVAIISPVPDPSLGKRSVHYLCALRMTLKDGSIVGDVGQLVITAQRVFGMISERPPGSPRLNDPERKMLLFSFDQADIDAIRPQTNWRGKPVSADIAIKTTLDRGFTVHVDDIAGVLLNDKAHGTTFGDFLERFTPEGIRELRS